MLDHAANAGRHALKERKDDLYETPPEAVRALLHAESIPPVVWECACGPGSIVRELRAAGHTVHATDLVDYGCAASRSGVDFLFEREAPVDVGAIVTNPPYKLASEFVLHALQLGIPKVVMLLRLAFLESERRRAILDSGRLARVYPFRNRLPMMHRDGWQGPKSSSSIPFAWFVWETGHKGPTELRRISWGSDTWRPLGEAAAAVVEKVRP